MARVDLIGKPAGTGPNDAMNIVISGLEGVQGAVYSRAQRIGGKAEAILAAHRYPPDDTQAEIEVTRGDVDSYVSLVDEAAMSIEYGHRDHRSGKFVPGLYIIRRAAGI